MNGKIICSVAAFSIVWGFAANPEVTPVLPMVQNSCYQVSTVEELYGFASAINGSNGFNKRYGECLHVSECGHYHQQRRVE